MEEKKATQVNGCKTCKKGLSNMQKGMVVISIYTFVSSIYGTYKFIEYLSNLF